MQSLRSRLVNALIRNRHLLQGRLRRESFSMASSIQDFRDQCTKSAAKMSRVPDGVRIGETAIAGIQAEWLVPQGAAPGKVILYIDGGGYVSGCCADHRGFVSTFSKNLGFSTLTYEYPSPPFKNRPPLPAKSRPLPTP